MQWWRRWRADLARPETETPREELGWLVGGALVIVVVSQWADPGSGLALVGVTAAVGGFLLRAFLPRLPAEVFAALVILPVTAVVSSSGQIEGALFLNVFMVLYVSWHLGSTTRAVLIAAASATFPLLVAVVGDTVALEEVGWAPWTLANGFTFTLGRILQRQRRLIEDLEQARRALADQAVAEERRRMARELHDLAGHTLAAILLQVTGARHVLGRDPAEAERALRDAEAVGRSSLDTIRATVAALRTDERGTDAALGDSTDLPDLVAEYCKAGLVVEATVADAARSLDGPVGIAVHRITREALANVARHAPANAVELRIEVDAGEAHLLVADHGLPATAPNPDSGHFGVVGMGERARALGGRLVAGPTDDGWRVEAQLPLVVGSTPVVRS